MIDHWNIRRTPHDAEPLAILMTDFLVDVHTMPPVLKGSTFIIRSMLKSELARLYGWGVDTFRRRLRGVGLNFGRSKLLLPREVAATVRALGLPSYEITF